MVSFCLLSDIHMAFYDVEMPEADYCIIAGDALNTGEAWELVEFNSWLGSIKDKYKKVYFCPGNHDRIFEFAQETSEKYLINAETVIEGFREIEDKQVYFCSWMPMFYNWSFMKSEKELADNHYNLIPEGLDLLITHSPPRYVLDQNKRNDHCGSKALRETLLKLHKPPLIHGFGHIHWTDNQPSYMEWNKTKCYNLSIMDDYYDPVHSPTVIEI